MKKMMTVSLLSLVLILSGCSGANKMRVPLAEIDRPIVNPKGTWEIVPSTGTYIDVRDTVTYRGTTYQALVLPSVEYSFTNNLLLQISNIIDFDLIWQLTKSPLQDTSKRYDWQIALDFGYSYFPQIGQLGIIYKKRLSPLVWNKGGLECELWYHLKEGLGYLAGMANDEFGFQLSEKASVTLGVGLRYATKSKPRFAVYYGGSGALKFHYSFSPWFGINVGTAIGYYQEHESTLSTWGSMEFIW